MFRSCQLITIFWNHQKLVNDFHMANFAIRFGDQSRGWNQEARGIRDQEMENPDQITSSD
jgi:hypothetical protein